MNGRLGDAVRRGESIHLVGIGGAGMAGLAALLGERGARVSGCDRSEGPTVDDLIQRGIPVEIGHDAAHVTGSSVVVHTAAVPADHPELEAARQRDVPVLKRSRALAELVNPGRLVAISGTHGKTTTAALTALALEATGLDPTALIGGRLPAWAGNARIGEGDVYVVEADEYDRAFLDLEPYVAVVTSVEPEHLDTYGTPTAVEAAFDMFVEATSAAGRLILCGDDPGARRRLGRASCGVLLYGTGDDVALRAEGLRYDAGRTRFSASYGGTDLGEFELALPGRHNVLNALAALGVVIALERDPSAAAAALAAFGGVERRFQKLGEAGGVMVVDDYAHHPTEVAATLEAARQAIGDRRLVVAFQPHLYTRTRAFADDFGRALAAADLILVTGIYAAREDPLPGVTARLVVDAARREAGDEVVRHVENLERLIEELLHVARPGDVVLTMGAGDIGTVGPRVLDELERSHVDA